MADFMATIGKAPKWLLITGAAVILAGAGYGVYYLAFGMNKPKEEVPDKILLDMPDAEVSDYGGTMLDEYNKQKYNARRGSSVSDYWDRLDDDLDKPDDGPELSVGDDLDPTIYSDYERTQIRNGIKTKEQIDREHAEAAARRASLEQTYATTGGSGYTATRTRQLTQAQQDSVFYARLDRAYSLAAKYSAAPGEAPQPDPPAEEPDRTIDLDGEDGVEASFLPMDSFADDGIISSLDQPASNDVVRYGSGVKVKPVKATFLKNEKLVSGNRVIMRLMQDLTLSDGTVIPANTHITGTVSIGRRMKINVSVLHYGGRMFPVDISVYDNDGTEGIYCPLVEESSSAKKKAKQVAGEVVQSAGSIAGTIFTGNPFIGSMATSGLRSATSSIGSDGSVSVNVSSGYEFFVYENVKDKS